MSPHVDAISAAGSVFVEGGVAQGEIVKGLLAQAPPWLISVALNQVLTSIRAGVVGRVSFLRFGS